MGVVGERRAAVKPIARLPVSLCTGLLACLPKFHTATRMPPDDTVQRARLLSIHTPACTPPGLPARRTARMRPVNSRLLTRHTGRVAACILFSIWMINVAALLLNRSMARIHCWSNAHGSNK